MARENKRLRKSFIKKLNRDGVTYVVHGTNKYGKRRISKIN